MGLLAGFGVKIFHHWPIWTPNSPQERRCYKSSSRGWMRILVGEQSLPCANHPTFGRSKDEEKNANYVTPLFFFDLDVVRPKGNHSFQHLVGHHQLTAKSRCFGQSTAQPYFVPYNGDNARMRSVSEAGLEHCVTRKNKTKTSQAEWKSHWGTLTLLIGNHSWCFSLFWGRNIFRLFKIKKNRQKHQKKKMKWKKWCFQIPLMGRWNSKLAEMVQNWYFLVAPSPPYI